MKSNPIPLQWLLITCWLWLTTSLAQAQLPVVEPPVIPAPDITIYVSTAGNNANPGTLAAPVATFQQAMQLIPFSPTADVHGEIVFLPGDYYPTQALVQGIADYTQGNYHRHISLVGMDSVNIYGNSVPTSHLIWLRGSGIRVENLNLFNAGGSALIISNPDASNVITAASQIHDVRIQNVTIDSTVSHSIISYFVDRLQYENIRISNGQQENTGVGGNCQWGSALRAEISNNITIRNCRVFHNRGEGINVAASSNALVEGNVAYDNFAPNFYCIRSHNVIFRKNLAYNRDSLYWRNCQSDAGGAPQVRKPTAGLSIANEVSYGDVPVSTCGSSSSFYNGVVSHKIADSIFIYNNIFILAPLFIVDESAAACLPYVAFYNNLSNIFVEHNSFIGDLSPAHEYQNQSPLISMVFNPNNFWGCFPNVDGRGVYRFENLVWKNNLISRADSVNGQPVSPATIIYGGRPCNGGTLPAQFTASSSLWHHQPGQVYDAYANALVPHFLIGSNDASHPLMGTHCDPEISLDSIIPNSDAAHSNFPFYYLTTSSSYITDDYFGNQRNTANNNAGAIAADVIVALSPADVSAPPGVFPNPNQGCFTLTWNQNLRDCVVHITDLRGQPIPFEQRCEGDGIQIEMKTSVTGIFFVKVQTQSAAGACKLIKTN